MVRLRFKSFPANETLTPGWVAHVHFPFPVEAVIGMGKESPKMVRARARNGLHRSNFILFEDG